MGEQPAADHRLRDARAFFPRGGRCEIAQPGKALELPGRVAVRTNDAEIQLRQRERVAATEKSAAEQGFAALAVTLDMVAWHGDELERLARTLEPGQQRAARQLLDDIALGRRALGRHWPPLSALMLAW